MTTPEQRAEWKAAKERVKAKRSADPEYDARVRAIQRASARRAEARQRAISPFIQTRKNFEAWSRIRGFDVEDLARAELAQGRCCRCCGDALDPTSRHGYQVDHCHQTGKFRAILCGPCNAAIGHVNDDIDRLIGCLAFVSQWRRRNNIHPDTRSA